VQFFLIDFEMNKKRAMELPKEISAMSVAAFRNSTPVRFTKEITVKPQWVNFTVRLLLA
jgi:hypothetical protein